MSITKGQRDKIDALISKGEKAFGEGVVQFGERKIEPFPTVCSTGSLNLDLALGIMGVPKGRVIEIYGPESGGKTTTALHMIRECQKAGKVAAFIDVEHALDPIWAMKLGVNMNELLVTQPDSGEEALSMAEIYAESGVVDLIIVDSVAAITTKAEIEGEMTDIQMGATARLMGKGLRKLTPKIGHSGCCLVFINQIRMKIGVMFGNPEDTTGGKALKFFSSIRIEVRNDGKGDVDDGFGQKVKNIKAKIVKNKVAPPFKVANLTLNTDEENSVYGFDKYEELLGICVSKDLIKKAGSWYSYKDERIGQGAANVAKWLKSNIEVYEELYKQVLNDINSTQTAIMESFSSKMQEEESKPTRRGKKEKEEVVDMETGEIKDAEVVEIKDAEVVEES
jgi:recombination protein RecA